MCACGVVGCAYCAFQVVCISFMCTANLMHDILFAFCCMLCAQSLRLKISLHCRGLCFVPDTWCSKHKLCFFLCVYSCIHQIVGALVHSQLCAQAAYSVQ